MKELPVMRKSAPDELGRECTYEYAILVGEMPVSPDISCESYGVSVRGEGQVAWVPNITVSAGRIDELMDLLVRNTVTPCTLKDVVDDWL